MNKKDLENVMSRANRSLPEPGLAVMSGELADRIHADTTGRVMASLEEVTALFLWQAMQFNGDWDMGAVTETMNWVRNRVYIVNTAGSFKPAEGSRYQMVEVS